MLGHDVGVLAARVSAFGWEAITIDGHNYFEIQQAYKKALVAKDRPVMVIAKTLKGKGVSLIEDKEGWHGKALSSEQLASALEEMGEVDLGLRVTLSLSRAKSKEQRAEISSESREQRAELNSESRIQHVEFSGLIATRKAYGLALTQLAQHDPRVVVLDAEVSNSTHAEEAKKVCPERFFEMFIAEQHMVGAAVGLAERGKIPFVSTFSAFFSRAFDQIRMAGVAESNIKFVGSHAGVSIGEDGSSQMGLEDIAMFRSVWGSVVLYPSDAIATEKLVHIAAHHKGLVYLRTTRKDTAVLYAGNEEFIIGGSKVIKQSAKDVLTIVGAGITVHEALSAYEELMKENIFIRVIDLYSVKPIDSKTLEKADMETKGLIVVEDHYAAGGIAEAVRSAVPDATVYSLAVHLLPRSGTAKELLEYEGISARAIINKVKSLI
jgi:transketolase